MFFFFHLPRETLMNGKQATQLIETKQAVTDKFEPCGGQITSAEQTINDDSAIIDHIR